MVTKSVIHIRNQQRNGRKSLTTVQVRQAKRRRVPFRTRVLQLVRALCAQ
jgi:translation initiation factor 1 (eIF-1/SUI1)